MRRITSVLDSSYIGLPYWTAWQAPKNIVWVPRPFAAERPLPALHLLLCQSRVDMMDGPIHSSVTPLAWSPPPPHTHTHPSSMGDLWQYQIALSSHGRFFHTASPLFSCSPARNKENGHRSNTWGQQQDRGRKRMPELRSLRTTACALH